MINQKMLNADHDTSVMLALRRYIAQKIRAFIQFAWNIFTVQQFANLLGLAFLCKQLFDCKIQAVNLNQLIPISCAPFFISLILFRTKATLFRFLRIRWFSGNSFRHRWSRIGRCFCATIRVIIRHGFFRRFVI